MKEDFPKANLHDDEVRKLKSELEILKKEIITLNNEKQKLNSANYDASKLAKDIESMKEDLRNSRAEIMYLQNKADSLIQHGYFEYNDLVMFLKSGENYMPITRSPVTYSLSIENIETIRKSKYW
jgi:seryl-tRNA synthetase